LNFNLKQHHSWSLPEIENLIPWERDIYLELLKQHIKEENEKAKNNKNG